MSESGRTRAAIFIQLLDGIRENIFHKESLLKIQGKFCSASRFQLFMHFANVWDAGNPLKVLNALERDERSFRGPGLSKNSTYSSSNDI